MRIAVFGAGRMAEIRIEDLVNDPRISGVSVINRSPLRAEMMKAKFGVKVLAEWLCGESIAEVYATRREREYHQYAEFNDGDVSLIHAITTSGVQISISGTRHDPRGHDVRFEIFGSKDSLSAGFAPRTSINLLDTGIELSSSPYSGFVDRFREAFRQETMAYIDWLAGKRDNPCSPDLARSGICIAIACEISARENRAVKVVEVRGS